MKLGILGTGMIVRDFLPQAHLIPGLELYALCSTPRSQPVMEQLAAQYRIPRRFTAWQELLTCGVDAVYVAVPNAMHYEMCRRALEQGCHVIVEKPMVTNVQQAEALWRIADRQGLLLMEAITTRYLSNYRAVRQELPGLGQLRLIRMDFSQYSSRYDAFRAGQILPAFDPRQAGGALMDLNIYNLHFVTGLLGAPLAYRYYPNLVRGIDVSGVMVLQYPGCVATLTAAKDSHAPNQSVLQGDAGYLVLETPANACGSFTVYPNGGPPRHVNVNPFSHRMVEEFAAFTCMIENRDMAACQEARSQSLLVSRIQTAARQDAGLLFPGED